MGEAFFAGEAIEYTVGPHRRHHATVLPPQGAEELVVAILGVGGNDVQHLGEGLTGLTQPLHLLDSHLQVGLGAGHPLRINAQGPTLAARRNPG